MGIYTFFFLPDCELSSEPGYCRSIPGQLDSYDACCGIDPETASFLTEAEKQAILADVPPHGPSMNSKNFDLGQIKSLLKNPTFVPFLVIWITHGIGGFGITFILPNVIYDLGMTDTAISQLMTMVRCLGSRKTREPLWTPSTNIP